jgi:hypothetical protein
MCTLLGSQVRVKNKIAGLQNVWRAADSPQLNQQVKPLHMVLLLPPRMRLHLPGEIAAEVTENT